MFKTIRPQVSDSCKVRTRTLPLFACGVFPLLLLFTSVCLADKPAYLGANLRGYNHTSSGVVSFYVNGDGGGRAGPYGEAGVICCAVLPRKWAAGIMMKVSWVKDPNALEPYPRVGTDEFRAYIVEHEKKYQRLQTLVELPPYDGGICGLEVHFLPCDEVKLSTSCWGYPSPNSPIKEPKKMKEPAVCQKQ